MLARFRAAHYQLAPEKFFIVQFLNCSPGLVDRLHLDEGETFGALIVAITHHFGVLDVADAVEEFEKIALGRVEGQIADVKTWRRDFDWLRFALRARFARLLRSLLILLLTVTRLRRWFSLATAVSSKECGDFLPECFLLGSLRALVWKTPAPAPASRPATPMALASPV